ncbi:RHS repeat-associated core domain-containing protein, partial [Pseudomonas sp. Colony2]
YIEEQNLRFQGQYLDRETGLHFNTFRFYDPDVGRFTTPDPI